MQIEISDEVIKNDKQGVIINFLDFIEQVYTQCPVYVDDSDENLIIVFQDPAKSLSVLKFSKDKFDNEKAIEVFNEVVYGK